MTSSKPYFLRAAYDWMVYNRCTPQLLVDTSCTSVIVPDICREGGTTVLSIPPTSVSNLDMKNAEITFSASFSGVPMDVVIPVESVLAIFSKENRRGLDFAAPPRKSPVLTIVK